MRNNITKVHRKYKATFHASAPRAPRPPRQRARSQAERGPRLAPAGIRCSSLLSTGWAPRAVRTSSTR